jgi:hypothetical protein
MKKQINTSLIMFICLIILASCASRKKFDFANAYKFKYIRQNQQKDKSEFANECNQESTEDKTTFISIEPASPVIREMNRLEQIEVDLKPPLFAEKTNHQIFEKTLDNARSLVTAYNDLPHAEKKMIRKEIRQTLRNFKNERIAPSYLASTKDYQKVNDDPVKQRRIARILLIGGGALVIVSLIVGGIWVLGTIGVIAVVVGAILMILSLG